MTFIVIGCNLEVAIFLQTNCKKTQQHDDSTIT